MYQLGLELFAAAWFGPKGFASVVYGLLVLHSGIPNAVEVYVSRLRAKLEPYGVALRSIRGFGYRLDVQTQETEAA